MYEVRPFGTLRGQDVPLIRLTDGNCTVELLPYGAAIRAIWVPDREGRTTDICLGYDTLEEYRDQDACFGGTIGRCANRVGGARFTVDGTEHLARQGQVLVMPAGKPHAVYAQEAFKMLLVVVFPPAP